jgi:hypothetical protein
VLVGDRSPERRSQAVTPGCHRIGDHNSNLVVKVVRNATPRPQSALDRGYERANGVRRQRVHRRLHPCSECITLNASASLMAAATDARNTVAVSQAGLTPAALRPALRMLFSLFACVCAREHVWYGSASLLAEKRRKEEAVRASIMAKLVETGVCGLRFLSMFAKRLRLHTDYGNR